MTDARPRDDQRAADASASGVVPLSLETPLPPELVRFLGLPTPQSLVVRGTPGSGKTTLGLTLLSHYDGRRLLVTKRVERDKLFTDFPWFRERANEVDVFDEDESVDDLRASARTVALLRLRERGSLERSNNGLGALAWLPPALRRAWPSDVGAGPTLVVIDSWDALVESYAGVPAAPDERLPDRAELERLLLRHLARSRARLVLVVERESPTQLDYLADGVVTTSRGRVDDRVERWLVLDKLRGVELADSDYLFTLKEGRFECFRAFSARRSDFSATAEPDPDFAGGGLWPGSRAFASAFGRPGLEKLLLVELNPSVPDELGELMVLPMATHVLRSGGRLLWLPSMTALPAEILSTYATAAPGADLADRLRLVSPHEARPEDAARWGAAMVSIARPTVGPPASDAGAGGTLSEAVRFLRTARRAGVPNLAIGHVSNVRWLFEAASDGDARSEGMATNLLRYLSGAPALAVVFAPSDDPLLPRLSQAASLHLRAVERRGHAIVFGVRPWTPGFALVKNRTLAPESAPYDLVAVV